MKHVRFETYELKNICINRNWFTGGTCEEYDKLFERCKEGADFDELALIIWLCTPDSNRKEIYYRLLIEKAALRVREFMIAVGCIDFDDVLRDEKELLDEIEKQLEEFVNE